MDCMRPLLKTLFAFTFVSTLSFGNAFAEEAASPQYPVIDYTHVQHPDLVKKGEYLTKTGDCVACHTDTLHHGKPFSGGLGLETPFGTFYTPNITNDNATGIGAWTDEEFVSAVREGAGPHGNYFPVFPYVYFNKMTKDEVLAIRAYLKAVPEVTRAPTPNMVPWPFNVRLSLYGWKMLFFYPYRGEYKPDATKSAQWNRGAYLVQGPTHCGMCHSPLNLLGAEERKYRYTGNLVLGYYAPDITSVGLKNYSVDQIIQVFKYNKTLNGKGQLAGPMKEANMDSFRYLTDADQRAIATYLKTVVSEKPTHASSVVTAETGPKVYNKYCAGCHANGGNGAPIFGDKAAWETRIKIGLVQLDQNAINGVNSMPPMGNCPTCSQDEIRATVKYMVDHSLNAGAGKKKNLDYFYGLPKLTSAQGQAIYEKNCAVCHAQNAAQPEAPKMGDVKTWAPILAHENFDDILTTVIHGQSLRRGAEPHPINGCCAKCSTAEVIAATKYLSQQSADGQYDFNLW